MAGFNGLGNDGLNLTNFVDLPDWLIAAMRAYNRGSYGLADVGSDALRGLAALDQQTRVPPGFDPGAMTFNAINRGLQAPSELGRALAGLESRRQQALYDFDRSKIGNIYRYIESTSPTFRHLQAAQRSVPSGSVSTPESGVTYSWPGWPWEQQDMTLPPPAAPIEPALEEEEEQA